MGKLNTIYRLSKKVKLEGTSLIKVSELTEFIESSDA